MGGVRGVLRYVRHINSTVWLLYLFIVFDRRGLLDRNSSECHFCVCVFFSSFLLRGIVHRVSFSFPLPQNQFFGWDIELLMRGAPENEKGARLYRSYVSSLFGGVGVTRASVYRFFLLCSLVSLRYFFASTQAVKIKPKSRVP